MRGSKLSLVLGTVLLATPMFAATKVADLAVSATVVANCTITTTPLDFGNYDPVGVNATADKAEATAGVVSVACTKGSTGLRIDLANGSNFSGTRRMAGGGDFLGYALYKDAAHATAWGSGAVLGLGLANAPSKAARTYSVYGLVPQNQDATVASYTDTVVATINF